SELSLMHLYPIDGAVHRVGVTDTAWGCRDARWSMVICGIDPDPGKAAALRSWGREYWQALHPFHGRGAYMNFMMDDELDGRVQAAYGPNYERLRCVKKKYDPANLFRLNQNVAPEV
ncbi:MAG: BBE domain-containing protein, partial [Steroidobacteraceae bacterium]